MSTIGFRLARLSLLSVAATWLLASQSQAEADKQPVRITIIVPEGATLYIDGEKTKAPGTRREFQSPPVAVGKSYYYTIKAVWTGPDGKDVTRQEKFSVKPGQPNVLDLTKEAPPKLVAKLTLDVAGALNADAGTKKAIAVKIKRENFKAAVKITVAGVPAGSKISELTITPDKSEGSVELEVAKDAKDSTTDLTVKAEGGDLKDEKKIKLSIKAAPPPPPAKITLEVPASVDVEAGAKKKFAVKIKRENVKSAIKVAFAGLPAGVTIPDAPIGSDASEVTVEVSAAKDAKVGSVDVTAKAEAGETKDEKKFKLNVKAAPKDDKDKDKPKDKDKDKPKDKDKDKDKPKDKDKVPEKDKDKGGDKDKDKPKDKDKDK